MHLQPYKLAICLLLIIASPSVAQKKVVSQEQSKSTNARKPFLIKPAEIKNSSIARENLSYLNQLLKLSSKDEFHFVLEKSDKEGFIKQRHQQFHSGIKVEYGVVTIHSKNNKIESIGGEVYDIPETLNSIPSISEEIALKAALQYTGAKKYKWENAGEETLLKKTQGAKATYFPSGELVYVNVYIPAGGKAMNEMSLAYKFDIYAEEPLSRNYVYVDAQTGDVIHVNAIIKHADGTAATRYSGTRTISTSPSNGNIYTLVDITRSSGIETYNLNNGSSYSLATDFTDVDNNWTSAEFNNSKKDNAALDAHWGAMKTYDFFKEKFNRNSYDDLGAKIKSYVHYETDYVNAFWNGSVMTYGDGSGSIGPLTALDICAHEIGHAICSSTADLVYSNESGALNESLSDIWGATVEHYAAPEKSPWLLGEDINLVIRSMSNPNEHDQPDTYLGTLWDPYQEVHTNSGVMNHWYYILTEGKSGVDDNGVAYAVQGIGFEKAARIVYRMETTYLTPNSQYANARIAAIQSAIDLFGSASVEVQQTRKAWDAVGVYDIISSPSDLIVTAVSSNSVNLSWTDHATSETGFIIERSLSFNSGFSEVATTAPNVTSYSNTGLATNAIYYYRVKASFIDYSSSYTNVASVALGTPPISMSNTTISTCSSVFLDPSGLSDYANSQNITMRIDPAETNKKVKVSFSSFSLSSYDYLYIYDGDAANQNFIGAYTGSTIPPDINALNSAGFLTFVFSSDSYNTGAGWQANLTCETTPSAPTNLNATTATTTQINLTWLDNSSNETGFRVERRAAASPNSSFINIATLPANSTSYSDIGLITNQMYFYRVKALVGSTYSSYTNIANGSVGNPPLIMQNGTYQICGSVFLDPGGNDNYSNNQSYIMRINPLEVGKKIKVAFSSFNLENGYDYLTVYDGDVAPSNLVGTYTGSTLPPEITAFNSSGGLSFVFLSDNYVTGLGWQANLTCVTIPNAPSNLIATTASTSQINLAWQDNSSDEISMIVERRAESVPNSPFLAVATLPANTTSYSNTGLATDEKYYYRVRAFNGTAYSPYSNIANATVGTLSLVMQSGVFQVCGSNFLDPGGYGNYNGYQYITMRVNPSQTEKKVKISFSSFSLGDYDNLTIYDGDALTSNLLGTFTGTTIPPDINALNSTGGLTFVFYSSGYTPSAGWQATLSCVDVPITPSNLIASAASGTQVNLSWQDNSTNETAFVIERKSGLPNSQYTVLATLAANITSYSDLNLPTDQRYFYRIKALNGTFYSAYSNVTDIALGNAPILMGNGVVSTCNAQFFDSGYTGSYSDGENFTLTVNPSTVGQKMRITFSSLSLESCCDRLLIYDGASISSTLVGAYNGSSLPPEITATNTQGSLTFQFYSDGSVTYSGWEASLTCVIVPNSPSNLVATTGSASQINLTWQDNSNDETSMIIERRAETVPNSPFLSIATLAANTTSYSDQGLATNEKYYYRVRAFNEIAYSSYSNTIDATLGTLPLIMQNGTFQVCGSNFLDPGASGNYGSYQYISMRVNPSQTGKKLKISFSSFSLNTSDYLVIYDGDPYQENLIGTYTGNTLPPDINALNATGGFTFVFSSNYYTNIGWLATLSCETIPNAPTSLAASAISASQINLAWQDNSANETGFVVERRLASEPNSVFANIATLAANSTSYSNQGLASNERYFYRVRALAGTTYSSYSNVADAVLGTPPLIMQNGTFQVCGSTFLDPGGLGNYSGYQNIIMRINPSQLGKKLKVSFNSFSLDYYDYLTIYDGDVLPENLIGTYSGTMVPPEVNAINSTGGFTFIFYSSGYYSGSGWQATLSCVDVPNAPSNLTGSVSAGTQVNLSWQDNSTNETAMIVERKTGVSSQFIVVATLAANTTSYLDQGLPTNQRYTYRIKAQNGTVYSAYTNSTSIELGSAPILMGSGVVSTCNAQFFDSGYTSDYSNRESSTLTINPSTNGGKVRVTFTSLNLESCCDQLAIYDGSSTNSTLIGIFSGNSLPPVITATNAQGSLTFQFYSDGSVTYSGWIANLTCIEPPAPTIIFDNVNKIFGTSPFDLNATAYFGANFIYSIVNDSSNTGEISLSGEGNKRVTILKSGTIKIKAFHPAANGYSDSEKIATLTVAKANQTITLPQIENRFNTADSFTVLASASSGLPVSLSVKSGPASVSGNTLTLSRELGTVIIEASQQGNQNYTPANMASTSFSVLLNPILGTEPVANDEEIRVWPIPTERFITVKIGSIKVAEISFADALGKKAFSIHPKSNEFQIDLGDYSPGMYFLKFSTRDGEVIKRLLIVK